MTLLGDATQSNGYIISAAATRGRSFQRGRSASPQRSHSSGGRSRPRTPEGKHVRSRSRTAGGTRKPRPRQGRSASPAFSVATGKYKFTPRGGTRLKQYKSKSEVCHQWQKTKTCSYGDACKFLRDSKAAVVHPKYEEPDPYPAVPATYTEDEIRDYDKIWDGDCDETDCEESVHATAYAFTKGKGKSKGKGKGKSKGKSKGGGNQ